MSTLPWKVAPKKPAHCCPVIGCRNRSRTKKPTASVKARLCSRHAMHLWRMEHPTEAHFAQIKDRAKRRGIAFIITLAEYIAAIADTGYAENRGRAAHNYHLDRIDALRGYEPGNIRVITASENCVKGATTDKERRRAYVDAKIKAAQQPEISTDDWSDHVENDIEPF